MAPRLKESSVHICEDSQSVGYMVLSQRKACGNVCFFTKKVLKHAQQVCSPLTCHFQFPCVKHKQEEQKPSAGYISEFVHISTSASMCFVQSTRVWFRAEILGKVFIKQSQKQPEWRHFSWQASHSETGIKEEGDVIWHKCVALW